MEERFDENWLFALCHLKASETDIVFLSRGETIDGKGKVCCVEEGTVQVFTCAEDGGKVLVNLLEKGSIFGIYDLFLPPSKQCTILKSKTKTKLVIVSKERIRKSLREDINSMEQYARFLNQKLQFLLHRIQQLTPSSARHRLVEYLIHTSDADGKVTFSSKEALAKQLGIGRSSLFREFGYLTQKGIARSEDHKRNSFLVDRGGLLAVFDEEEES
jgi:CRP-like cAMP-binding protein